MNGRDRQRWVSLLGNALCWLGRPQSASWRFSLACSAILYLHQSADRLQLASEHLKWPGTVPVENRPHSFLPHYKLNTMRATSRTLRTVLVVGLLSAISAAVAEPVKYLPPDEAFEVTFPDRPQCETQRLELSNGPIVMSSCSYVNASAQLYYVATSYEGWRVSEHLSATDALKSAMNFAASSTNSTVLATHNLEVSGFPALEGAIRHPNGLVSISQYVLANGRLFSINFAGWPGRVPNEALNSFMSSFRLNPSKNR
jgi:hypothetical protein